MLATTLSPRIRLFIRKSYTFCTKVKETLIEAACRDNDVVSCCRALIYLLYMPQYEDTDRGAILLFEELQDTFIREENMKALVSTLQYYQQYLHSHRIPIPSSSPTIDQIWLKAAYYRCILMNNYVSSFNTLDDKSVVLAAKEFLLTTTTDNHKDSLAHQWFVEYFTD